MTNAQRAEHGRAALDTYTRLMNGEPVSALHPEDVGAAVTDLIADLGHFVRLFKEQNPDVDISDADGTFESAANHYAVERSADWNEES